MFTMAFTIGKCGTSVVTPFVLTPSESCQNSELGLCELGSALADSLLVSACDDFRVAFNVGDRMNLFAQIPFASQ